MTLLLALMNPAEAACSLALDDTLHAAPGRDLDITWSGTGSYSHVALTAFDTWGTVHHIQVTANDGHTVWTLPDTLHHDDRLWVHISTAPGGVPTTHCRDELPLTVAYEVDIGFAVDTLADINQQPMKFSRVMTELLSTGPLADNGLPNLTINQNSRTGWAWTQAIVPVSTVSGDLKTIADRANLMVGLADIPFNPLAAGCGSNLPNSLPTEEYGTYTPLQVLQSQQDGNRQQRVGFAPEFTSSMCTVPFESGDYQVWVEELAFTLDGAKGEVSYETGNEPDGPYFFWGDASSYHRKAKAATAGVRLGDTDARVTYGGFGSSTTFDLGKVGDSSNNSWDVFRKTLYYTPDESFSFHLFRNPGFGDYVPNSGTQFEKKWDDLHKVTWPATNADHVVLSAFDLFGRNSQKDTYGNTVESTWKVAMEDSSWLTYELAELLYFAYDNDIDIVYLWKLMDDTSSAQSGFFDECGEARWGYAQLAEVWAVVEDGYSASRDSDGVVTIEGVNGRILMASDGHVFNHTSDMDVIACWQNDLDTLVIPQGLVGSNVLASWHSMDWVIYEEVPAGTGSACPAPTYVASSCQVL